MITFKTETATELYKETMKRWYWYKTKVYSWKDMPKEVTKLFEAANDEDVLELYNHFISLGEIDNKFLLWFHKSTKERTFQAARRFLDQ